MIAGGVIGPDPAHRHGDAVPRAGRLVRRHQLDHRGAADPGQRLGPRSTATTRRDARAQGARTPDGRRTGGAMTRYIRRAAAFCALLLARPARQRRPRPGLPGRGATTTTRPTAARRSPVTASRAATSWSAAGRSPAPRTPASSCATNGRTPNGPLYAPVTGFASQTYGTTLPGARRGRHPVRHRPAALRRSRCGTTSPAASSPAARSSPPSSRPRSRPPTRGSAAAGARSPRSSRRPGGSWRWSPRPSYDPGVLSGNGPRGRARRGRG